MKALPVILISSSQGEGSPLPYIADEMAAISDALIKKRSDCFFEQLSAVHMDSIRKALQRNLGLVRAFHFSGHGNEKGIFLGSTQGKKRMAFAENLAKILGIKENIGLVFLNACATQGQVKAFTQEKNIKVVISTTHRVKDEVAFAFARVFYDEFANGQTIQEAFDIAHAQLSYELGISDEALTPEMIYRDLMSIKGKGSPEDWKRPYVIDAQEGQFLHQSLKGWCQELSRKEGGYDLPEIPDKAYENCDRNPQKGAFQEIYLRAHEEEVRRPQFIISTGHKDEAPDQLGSCLIRHVLPVLEGKKGGQSFRTPEVRHAGNLDVSNIQSENAYKFHLLPSLKKALDHDVKVTLDLQEILRQTSSHSDVLWIEHTFYEKNWAKPLPGLLERYITECWDLELGEHDPQVYIFFNFVYEKTTGVRRLWAAQRNIQNALLKLAKKVDNCHMMPELEMVDDSDLGQWCREYNIESPSIKEAVFNIVKDGGNKSMLSIHKELQNIIKGIGQLRWQDETQLVS